MSRRLEAGVVVAACLAVASSSVIVAAQEAPGPKPTLTMLDRTQAEGMIDACLADEDGAEMGYRGCIRAVADACEAMPENEGLYSWTPCMAGELALWDDRVTRTYDETVALAQSRGEPGASKPDAEALIASQTAWLAYRDSECRMQEAVWLGGADGPSAALGCRLQLTAERAIDLWLVLKTVASP